MPNITIRNTDGTKTIQAQDGANLYSVLAGLGYIENAPCGGKGLCGKCKVKIMGSDIPTTKEDTNLLSDKELEDGVRLSCKVTIDKDLEVEVNNSLKSFGGITILNDDIMPKGLLFALDIGTTTLDGVLIDEESQIQLVRFTKMNSQKKYGADVFTRMNYSLESEQNRKNLMDVIMDDINGMAKEMTDALNVTPSAISSFTVAGNTTMIHMLLCKDVKKLAFAPFVTEYLAPKDVLSSDIGFISKDAAVNIMPASSSFIGGDITSGAVVMGVDKAHENSLFIDLGTNGEMILTNGDSVVGCSVAAGPAFEGAEIACGMSALKGAISYVVYDEEKKDIVYKTIDDGKPRGICGSGLIDVVALFKKYSIIDETGRIVDEHENAAFNNRIFKIEDENCFKLYENEGDMVYIGQRDIRNFQLAKAAIKTGIVMLLEKEELEPCQIDTVYIAGGFGKHISNESLFGSDIMPFSHDNIKVVGNTSLKGAIKSSCDNGFKQSVYDFSEKVEVFLLSKHPNFQMMFVDNMMF